MPTVLHANGVPPPHFLVFVPGFLGSKLRDRTTGKLVWLDFSSVPLLPSAWPGWLDFLFETMRYPNDNLEPAGIIEDVLFAPPWIKQEQYSRLLRILESWGYRADPKRFSEKELNVYTFAYDWRQDNRISARQLGHAIERWRALHPGEQVWLMGHSNGGILSRWYIEKEGGKDIVSRLFLLASPWDGSPKALYMLFQGFDILLRLGFDPFEIAERTRDVLRSFPCTYQLIPQARDFLRGPNNEVIDPFVGENWLENPQQCKLLEDGRRFNQELGNQLSVETLAFFGRQLATTTFGRVDLVGGTRWRKIEWFDAEIGDGTLPEYSAVFSAIDRNIPLIAEHGNIYVNPELYLILKWELVDKYGIRAGRPPKIHERLSVTFRSDQSAYAPGAPMQLSAVLTRQPSGRPLSGAHITVQLRWLQPLPGSTLTSTALKIPRLELKETSTRGVYHGQLSAPRTEGYYQLEATIALPREKPMTAYELIAVEPLARQSTSLI